MTSHPNHVDNARRALAYYDKAPSGSEASRRAVVAAAALRVLVYEPADGYQGDFIEGPHRTKAAAG